MIAAEKIAQEAINDTLHPERPRPLMRELPHAHPFPIEALGKILGDAAKAIHDKVQANSHWRAVRTSCSQFMCPRAC